MFFLVYCLTCLLLLIKVVNWCKYTQKMEADVDVDSLDDKAFAAYAEKVGERFSKTGEDLVETLKELNKTMEGRTAWVVKSMLEMFDTKEEAIAQLEGMGYSKDDIRESG